MTGMIVGTPAYMAPEQANGEPLAAASDLFSVGVLLYEMLTGVKPFYGENNTEILSKIIRNKYIPAERINPDIPRAFRKIIKKSLHKDPLQRYANATEMINDLERAIPWQVRSNKKQVIGRFLKDLDKTKASSGTDPLKFQVYAAMPSWGWRVLRYGMVTLALGLLIFQGWNFKRNQLGSLSIILDRPAYVQLDQRTPSAAVRGVTRFGPLVKGLHRLRVGGMQGEGIFLTDAAILPGQATEINVPLQAEADSARLVVNSIPSGGQIFLDGLFWGTAPAKALKLSIGSHQIEIRKHGFRTRNEKLTVHSGQIYRVEYHLIPSEQ